MRAAVAAIASLLSACATNAPDNSVSPRQLNENPAAFDGVEVTVRGMLVLGTNGRSLYQSEERFNHWVREFESGTVDFDAYTADCLTLAGAAASLVENTHLLHKRSVALRGKYVANHYPADAVDLQKCRNYSALVVDPGSAQAVIRNAGGSVK